VLISRGDLTRVFSEKRSPSEATNFKPLIQNNYSFLPEFKHLLTFLENQNDRKIYMS